MLTIIKNNKEASVVLACIAFSAIMGILSDDFLIGGEILATGLTSAYYASIGKRINYILGCLNYLLIAYVSLKNNLYGIVISYTLIFAPLQIIGFFSWRKQLDANNTVKARKFTLLHGVLVVTASLVSSLVIGYLLSLIPSQQLSYLDATTNCINLFGVILMILRYEEAFWLWLCNNILDMVIWTLILVRGGDGAFMMFVVSLGFLLINLYGIAKWHQRATVCHNKLKQQGGADGVSLH